MPTVDEILKAWTFPGVDTHWSGCELSHPTCAIQRLATEAKRLDAEREALADALRGMGCEPEAIERVAREARPSLIEARASSA
ncbi:MAG: hypothetical protein H6648_08835 [Caldilineae bacterium]|nr:hypothetical protein [Chloroflexota bacterium]MCB9177251.1 hypothetical protein [Caldilineae bacterium]